MKTPDGIKIAFLPDTNSTRPLGNMAGDLLDDGSGVVFYAGLNGEFDYDAVPKGEAGQWIYPVCEVGLRSRMNPQGYRPEEVEAILSAQGQGKSLKEILPLRYL